MLRSLVFVLLLVNAGFYAWSQGWLDDIVGVRPDAQHEPQRLTQQLHADQLIVLPPSASASPTQQAAAPASPASAAPSEPPPASRTICLEAGPFTATEHTQVDAALKPLLAPRQWGTENVVVQGSWLLYMGPYADPATLARKQAELRRMRSLSFEEVHAPANLAPGLSLGRFSRLEDANAALDAMKLRGIRSARVVTLRPPTDQTIVRVPEADIKTQVLISGVKLPQGKTFTACGQ
ncbi:MAG: SPOR domain-containing protein [Burkholderiales bacterium]|nr:SPOR domain-containing protein [Burkholderiales bacterium]